MKWIKSGGRPLICVERELAQFWHGTGESEQENAMQSDYDRACSVADYLGVISLQKGFTLVLGDMPLETAVWKTASEHVLIVRPFYLDAGTNLPELLGAYGELCFANLVESIRFDIESGHMVIFDSAISGTCEDKDALSFVISPGAYQILTTVFEPDDRTSVLLHKFERNQ